MMTARAVWTGKRLFAALLAVLLVAATPNLAGAITTVGPGVDQIIRGTNDFRAGQGGTRLTHHTGLTDVAQRWANRMVADYNAGMAIGDAFRHNPNLRADVAAATGGSSTWGENIAWNSGYSNPYSQMVSQWILSDGHRANMLRAAYTHIGVGTAQANDGSYFGVQVFAAPHGGVSSAPGSLTVSVDVTGLSGVGSEGCVELVRQSGATFVPFADYCVPATSPTTSVRFSDIPPGNYSARIHDFVPGASAYVGGTAQPGTTVAVNSGSHASVSASAAIPGDLSLTIQRSGHSTTGSFCYTILGLNNSTVEQECVGSASSHEVSVEGYVGVPYRARISGHSAEPTEYYLGAACQGNALPLVAGTSPGGAEYTWAFGDPWPCLTDVTQATPFFEELIALQHSGVTTGYDDGTYRPGLPVSRQAMAAFLYRIAGEPDFDEPSESEFSDVPTTHPFFREISWMADAGLSTGYDDGTFKPGSAISRQAMAAFLYRLSGDSHPAPGSAPFSDVPANHPFATPIAWMADVGISAGYSDGSFRPTAQVTRLAMAPFVVRYMEAFPP